MLAYLNNKALRSYLYINLACLGALMLPWVIRTFLASSAWTWLPGPLRLSGPAVRTIAFTVGLSGPKNGCQELFFVSAQKNAKQTNTFVGFSGYVSIPIRLYAEIECHI